MKLNELVVESARRTPGATAVIAPDGDLSYAELDALASQVARALGRLGVSKGDRVGVWLEKSFKTVAAMQGVLRLGAAYVPVDPQGPASRARSIFEDCDTRAVVTSGERRNALWANESAAMPTLLTDTSGGGGKTGWDALADYSGAAVEDAGATEHDLAYILYTSGSTGKPKGVCISHRNALAFVDWAVEELGAGPGDRFSNHAPFHFDLSVLDLYAAFATGASVALVPERASYSGRDLVEFVLKNRITIWYSVPSVLIMMIESGNFLELDHLPLEAVIFAGEVFPIKYVRAIRKRWPELRLLNFYGPTETNVCTYYEVRDVPDDQTKPVPIGRACSGDRCWVSRPDGGEAASGETGELMVAGPTVMLGYWGRTGDGRQIYATGDIVIERPDGNLEYHGRKDHQIKIRGNRVELGEIEAALLEHPALKEVAVVVSGEGVTARLIAFAICSNEKNPTLLSIKKHCAERLPRYMIIDKLRILADLPRTANGKIDRIKLLDTAREN